MLEAEPVLYSFRRCPYAIRARLALLVSGQACVIREVKLSAKPAEMLAASPKGTVPVLVLPDGRVIDESLDVMRWGLQRHDPEGWLLGDDTALIAANDGPFKDALDRTKYPARHQSDPEAHRADGLRFLETLDTRLAIADNLCGDGMTLTDAAILPFVRQFAAIDAVWFQGQDLPALQAWLARHLASPLFEAAMVRFATWQPGDAPLMFPG